MTTTAQIAAKGCNNTGVTEEIAKRFHDQLGRTGVAIIEITSEARTETKAGDEKVKLSIGLLEVAPNSMTEDHLRELARAFHYERKLAEDGPTLPTDGDDLEPKVADVLAAGGRHRPHPYLASTLGVEDNPVCDVCGQAEDRPVHADRIRLADPFDPDTEHDADDQNDDAGEGDEDDEDDTHPDQYDPDDDNQ